MKRLFYLIMLLAGMFTAKSQTVGIYVGPVPCYYANVTTSVMVTQTVSGATSYSWASYAAGGLCGSTVTSISSGLYGSIAFGCCGSHTVTCIALNASMTPIASTSTVIVIGCPVSLATVASPTLVCAGNASTLYAGGASSFTWLAPGGVISNSSMVVVNPTTTTCYTLIGANAGCSSSTIKCVSVSASPSISISGPSSICYGDSLYLTASGASTYTWSNNMQGAQVYLQPTSTTCYTVLGTSSQGCIGYATKCVTVSSGGTVFVSGPNSICSGSFVVLQAFGGSSYSWAPGGMTSSSVIVSPTVSTCYTVYAFGSCGNGSAVKCVSVNPTPVLTIVASGGSCSGQTRTLTVSGASSYTWYPGNLTGSSIVVTPSATTCYSVVGVNSSGCTGVTGTCLTVQSGNFGVTGPTVLCAGNSAVLTVTASGTFTWLPGGTTGNSITVTPSATTCYTVIGNVGGCAGSGIKCITVSSPPNLTVTGPPIVCFGSYGVFSATGASSYTWYPTLQTGSQVATLPSSSGCYTVAGTNISGCTGYGAICFSVVAGPTVSISGNTVVCGGSSTTLTASGATSYTWYPTFSSGSSIVISPSVTTCYTVQGSNGTACTSYAVRCVAVQNSNVSVIGPSSICSGQNASLVATGATSYTWQPGNIVSANIVVSPTTTTCYTVTGATGTNSACSSSTVRCINVNPYPVISTGSGGFCAGQPGQISASGATSYTWYPYNLTGSLITITPTVSGCYTVVGSNSANCMSSAFGCFSVFPSPSLSVSGPTVICPNTTATLVASGANTYTWLPGNLSGSVVVVSPTATTCYTIFGASANGCVSNTAKCITIQTGNLSVSGPNAICSGNSVTLTASGAGSYTWQPGSLTGASIVVSPSAATCYTVTGTIVNGNCQASAVKCVGVGSTPTITTNAGAYCTGQTAVFTAQGALTYSWLPFGSTGSSVVVTPTASGCFTVAGTNSAGCTGSAVNCYSVIPAPSVSITGNTFLCPGDSTILTASGASSYTWLPGGSTGSMLFISPTSSTCYTLIATNGYCTSSSVKCVQVSPAPNVSITAGNFACAGSPYVLVASGANSYLWSNGATTPTIVVTPTASGCFTVTGTNGPNCSASAVKCFSVINSVSLTIGGVHTICRGQLANITASGAQTYKWNTGSTSSVLFVSPAFNTVYTVTGSIGSCSDVRTVQITVNQSPTITIASTHSVVCPGASAILTASGAQTYTWLPTGITAPTMAVSPTVTTSYVVNGASAQGCAGAATITVLAGQCTGVNEVAESRQVFGVFPNPAINNISISASKAVNVRVNVYDMLGRNVHASDFITSTVIDVSAFSRGTYIVKLESGGTCEYRRLVIGE